MKLTTYQTDALLVLRARLDPTHPGFNASDDIADALNVARYYLDSWVFPYLDVIAGENKYSREYLAQDADYVRIKMQEAKTCTP